MYIEIAEPGKMTPSGSSLMKMIQNNKSPVLDLLVRESIQNSLDAGKEKEKYVSVEFLTGKFNRGRFNKNLDVVGPKLDKRYPQKEYEYVAVRDSGTVGLTGEVDVTKVTDPKRYGNLFKLVYDISKPQEKEGAGGSWGLGKTVYFRVGIGLVVYYSRIRTASGYRSRLAVTMVEDETSENALIPAYKGTLKRGIAWWGAKKGVNNTVPITDESLIREVLDCFGIMPYIGKETGTTVIIPYIDSKYLLGHNTHFTSEEEGEVPPYWSHSLEEYLAVSVQRWYAPRLNNSRYKYGHYLKAGVNGNEIDFDDMEPSFQIVQRLYNLACGESAGDAFSEGNSPYNEKIALRGVLAKETAGNVAYIKVDRATLHMKTPHNKPAPHVCFNCKKRGGEMNRPVIGFVRKPGMIVSYKNCGEWADGLPETDPENYIIALFVLNSENSLKQEKISLEEYIRKSEMADHTDWSDYTVGDNVTPRIVSKVQDQIIKKISKTFQTQQEQSDSAKNTGMGKMLGDLILPPQNFGKRPSSKSDDDGREDNGKKGPTLRLIMLPEKTVYGADSVTAEMKVSARKKTGRIHVDLRVEAENGSISVKEWESSMGMKMPFSLESLEAKLIDDNNKSVPLYFRVEKDNEQVTEGNILRLVKSAKHTGYRIIFIPDTSKTFELNIKVTLSVCRRDLKPLFILEEEKGDS